ncbi:MAG: hypothetical protein JWN17_1257 [Frankiales bacterium]|nr:hypothetical protein [Frankiales bacterium]
MNPDLVQEENPVADDQPESEQPAPRKSSRRKGASAAEESSSPAGSLASALRELVTGIEDEVAEVTRLSEVIDDHVVTLNGLRADVAARLAHLDELRAAADDANLGAFLDDTIQPQLPQQSEDFPDRIYGS